MKVRKEEIQLLLFIDDIVYIENPKESTEKIWKSIRPFGQVTEYKIKVQMPIAFLYISKTSQKIQLKKKDTIYSSSKSTKREIFQNERALYENILRLCGLTLKKG